MFLAAAVHTLPPPSSPAHPAPLQVLDLLPLADSVTKLAAHCKFCEQGGRRVPASFSLRISADRRQEVVGGADVYAPVCRRHYVELARPAAAGAPEAAAAGEEA